MSDLTNSLVYPFDTTGTLSSNHIPNEMQVLTPNDFSKFHFIVPKAAPYFVDSMKVTIRLLDNTVKPLDRRDWFPTHEFIDASRSYAMPVAGSVSFGDLNLTGTIYLDYQTVGGVWVQDEAKITEILENYINNPRVTVWDEVANIPFRFPPVNHQWDVEDMVGMSAVVAAIGRVEEQLRLQGQAGLADHLANFSNPHRVDKNQIALGLVQNFGVATTDQAVAGIVTDAYMTPALVAAYVIAKVYKPLLAHMTDTSNPHGTDAHQTGAYFRKEVDDLLATKVGKTEAAYDSDHFGGQTPIQYAATILQNGTASNALALNGVSYSQIMQSIRDAAGSATSLNGMSIDDIKTEVLKGTAANATNFSGKSLDEVKSYTLQGKAASAGKADDSALAYGLTQDQLSASVLQGKATDSGMFAGQTPAQFTASVKDAMGGGGTRQIVHPAISNQDATITNDWLEIGHVYYDPSNAMSSADNDTIWFVAGGEPMGDHDAITGSYDTPLHMLRVSPRRPGIGIYSAVMNSVDTTVTFGYTKSMTTVDGVLMADLTIYLKTGRNRTNVTVTEIALGNAVTTTAGAAAETTTEPSTIVYSVDNTVVMNDVLDAVNTAITDTVTALRTETETGFTNLAASVTSLATALSA